MGKAEERALAQSQRRGLSNEERAQYSHEICRRIAALPCFANAVSILSYMATWDEVDLSELEAYGKRIAYPKTYKAGRMEAFIPGGFSVGTYGIREPKPELSEAVAPEEFDLVLVPCVGFDESCRRIGHGAGYYDRYLPMCNNAVFVCVAFEAQKLPQVSTDEHDIKMHRIVTECGEYIPEELQ